MRSIHYQSDKVEDGTGFRSKRLDFAVAFVQPVTLTPEKYFRSGVLQDFTDIYNELTIPEMKVALNNGPFHNNPLKEVALEDVTLEEKEVALHEVKLEGKEKEVALHEVKLEGKEVKLEEDATGGFLASFGPRPREGCSTTSALDLEVVLPPNSVGLDHFSISPTSESSWLHNENFAIDTFGEHGEGKHGEGKKVANLKGRAMRFRAVNKNYLDKLRNEQLPVENTPYSPIPPSLSSPPCVNDFLMAHWEPPKGAKRSSWLKRVWKGTKKAFRR